MRIALLSAAAIAWLRRPGASLVAQRARPGALASPGAGMAVARNVCRFALMTDARWPSQSRVFVLLLVPSLLMQTIPVAAAPLLAPGGRDPRLPAQRCRPAVHCPEPFERFFREVLTKKMRRSGLATARCWRTTSSPGPRAEIPTRTHTRGQRLLA
jgi:hypothetical protein